MRQTLCSDGRQNAPDRSHPSAEAPWEVQITFVLRSRAPTLRERVGHVPILSSAPGIAVLLLIAGALGAVVVFALGRGPFAVPDKLDALRRDSGPAGVAAAYGYPLRCLSITIPARDRAYARADFDRTAPCGRYEGYPTAIFHRVGGAWRPVLDAVSYSCPVASLPRSVQAELAVCPVPSPRAH